VLQSVPKYAILVSVVKKNKKTKEGCMMKKALKYIGGKTFKHFTNNKIYSGEFEFPTFTTNDDTGRKREIVIIKTITCWLAVDTAE